MTMFLYTWLAVVIGMIAGNFIRALTMERELLKLKGMATVNRKKRQRMTIQLLIRLMVTYGILINDEACAVLNTGMLPDDILERLHLADVAQKN